MSIRICRHCKKGVPLQATECPHCHGKLMNPKIFMASLAIMGIMLFISFTAVAYAYLEYRDAKDALYCKETFYHRASGAEGITCQAACTDACAEKGMDVKKGLLLTSVYKADDASATISCECTCNGCFR